MQAGKLYIHATNVHQGGGKALLWSIIEALPRSGLAVLVLDSRMPLPNDIPENIKIEKVSPSILQRMRAEKWLAQNVQSQDVVICFGNLPPLLKLRGRTVVFVQNRYLIDDVKLNEFSLKVRLRFAIERMWISKKMVNVDEFVVQTPTMKRLLERKLGGKIPVRIMPFMAELGGYSREVMQLVMLEKNDFDFVYVASGEPHKNHRQLIEAWCLLAKEGVFPALKLTVDRAHFAELCSWMEQKVEQYRLNVENAGNLPHGKIKQLYDQAGALIYPSIFESFGLPLIEARQAGLPVLASELDYVRDVLDPEQTFDPESAVSIARAVKRFMGIEEQPLPLQDAAGFMQYIVERAE